MSRRRKHVPFVSGMYCLRGKAESKLLRAVRRPGKSADCMVALLAHRTLHVLRILHLSEVKIQLRGQLSAQVRGNVSESSLLIKRR